MKEPSQKRLLPPSPLHAGQITGFLASCPGPGPAYGPSPRSCPSPVPVLSLVLALVLYHHGCMLGTAPERKPLGLRCLHHHLLAYRTLCFVLGGDLEPGPLETIGSPSLVLASPAAFSPGEASRYVSW